MLSKVENKFLLAYVTNMFVVLILLFCIIIFVLQGEEMQRLDIEEDSYLIRAVQAEQDILYIHVIDMGYHIDIGLQAPVYDM